MPSSSQIIEAINRQIGNKSAEPAGAAS